MIKVCFVADGELNVDLIEQDELGMHIRDMMESYDIEPEDFKFMVNGQWQTIKELLIPALDDVTPSMAKVNGLPGRILSTITKNGKTEYLVDVDSDLCSRYVDESEVQIA